MNFSRALDRHVLLRDTVGILDGKGTVPVHGQHLSGGLRSRTEGSIQSTSLEARNGCIVVVAGDASDKRGHCADSKAKFALKRYTTAKLLTGRDPECKKH